MTRIALCLLALILLVILWPRRRESVTPWDEEPDGVQVDPRPFTLVAGAGHAAIPHRPGGWANDCPMCEVQVQRFLDDVRRGRRD